VSDRPVGDERADAIDRCAGWSSCSSTLARRAGAFTRRVWRWDGVAAGAATGR